jgi:hypothetical protein
VPGLGAAAALAGPGRVVPAEGGALSCIHRCGSEPKVCTPPHRSTARPQPCWLRPGVAARPGLRRKTSTCEG